MIISKKLETFIIDIERIQKENDCSCIDAIVEWSERFDIPIESLANYINKSDKLLSKITEEAESLNFIKKSARLNFETVSE